MAIPDPIPFFGNTHPPVANRRSPRDRRLQSPLHRPVLGATLSTTCNARRSAAGWGQHDARNTRATTLPPALQVSSNLVFRSPNCVTRDTHDQWHLIEFAAFANIGLAFPITERCTLSTAKRRFVGRTALLMSASHYWAHSSSLFRWT